MTGSSPVPPSSSLNPPNPSQIVIPATQYSTIPSTTQASSPKVEWRLPQDFRSIYDIVNMPNDELIRKPMVNVFGIVTDVQVPMPPRREGNDWKSAITITDYTHTETKLHYFEKSAAGIPTVSGPGDIVMFRTVKVQMWDGCVALLKNYATTTFVFPKADITASSAKWDPTRSKGPGLKANPPTPDEIAIVVELHRSIDDFDFRIPTAEVFELKQEQSAVVKDKFTLVENINLNNGRAKDKDGMGNPYVFHDMIGEVVQLVENGRLVEDLEQREKDGFGTMTVHLTDYTSHDMLYDHKRLTESDEDGDRDGDPHGYIPQRQASSPPWPGPYGKMTIQLTLYDGNADYTRRKVEPGDWIHVRNVQLKMGRNGVYLEGYMRGDQDAYRSKRIDLIHAAEDPEDNDPRWVDAVRRRKAYEKRSKKEHKESKKRKAGEEKACPQPAKKPRHAKKQEKKKAEAEKTEAEALMAERQANLNPNVRSERPDVLPQPIASIISEPLEDKVDPFDKKDIKADIRVIDYSPHSLIDFCKSRFVADDDVIAGDESEESDDDSESDDEATFRRPRKGKTVWEWKFSLRVEDKGGKRGEGRIMPSYWLTIDNKAAEYLLYIDAQDLSTNKDALGLLEKKLWVLWGDLHEQKTKFLAVLNDKAAAARERLAAPSPKVRKVPPLNLGGMPPIDDGDTNNENLQEVIKKTLTPQQRKDAALKTLKPKELLLVADDVEIDPSEIPEDVLSGFVRNLGLHNQPFACCIKEIGVKDKSKMETGKEGSMVRWNQKLLMYGTSILGDFTPPTSQNPSQGASEPSECDSLLMIHSNET